MNVSVQAVADALTLEVHDALGSEDAAIPLDLSAALTDTDGSETLSITIEGVPEGASLSAGTDLGNGTWRLTADQLQGLKFTPPADAHGEYTLTVTATATDASGHTATTTQPLNVSVQAVADAPTLHVQDAAGMRGEHIPLRIDAGLVDVDGSERLTIAVSGVPEGATLSAGSKQSDGLWILQPEDLDGLTLQATGVQGTLDLTVTATATDANGHAAAVSHAVQVRIDPLPTEAPQGEPAADPQGDGAPPADADGPGAGPVVAHGDGHPDSVGPAEELAEDWADRAADELEQLREQVEAISLEATSVQLTTPKPMVGVLSHEVYEQAEAQSRPIPAPSQPLFALDPMQASAGEGSASEAQASARTDASEPPKANPNTPQAEAPSKGPGALFGVLWAMVRSIGPNRQDKDRNG
ncbi:MAG: hypothetical protein KatS3mg103_0216 [Phycisphaerales bacterium]|nr:MAG: hypothetical protein KatS3mg103_0216 [Phycisphaerales bacterium]